MYYFYNEGYCTSKVIAQLQRLIFDILKGNIELNLEIIILIVIIICYTINNKHNDGIKWGHKNAGNQKCYQEIW